MPIDLKPSKQKPQPCRLCQNCYNMGCPVKHTLHLFSGIDCGALFRVLDKHGIPCEFQPVPQEAQQVREIVTM